MQTLWIGDFRAKQIQLYDFSNKKKSEADKNTDENDKYLLDDFADFTWFEDNAIAQLPLFAYNSGNVVIMLGFNDCVYSCVWKNHFNIKQIAANYANRIKDLEKQYAGFIFYFCSVNPVDVDYPFAPYGSTGLIPKEILNNQIKDFNQKVKEVLGDVGSLGAPSKSVDSSADDPTEGRGDDSVDGEGADTRDQTPTDFIDCATYLKDTGYETYDGISYTEDSCEHIYNFITSSFMYTTTSTRTLGLLRDTKDKAPRPGDDTWEYWVCTPDGKNNCINIKDGCALPNCVGYAWGRFYEILGKTPKLSTGNAGEWWDYTKDGYERSQTPEVGAVICWKKAGSKGHVGIVESYDPITGEIKTSESGYKKGQSYNPEKHFWVETRVYDKNTNNWRRSSKGKPIKSWVDDGYVFQGFILNPGVKPIGTQSNGRVNTGVAKDQVFSNNNYLKQSEMETNALYIWSYLGTRGWSLNAVAGILGNMQHESTINPGLGEKGHSKSGFGLVQWTPKSNLTDWLADQDTEYADDDIDGQLERIIWEKENNRQYSKNKYKYTFKEFAVSTDDPYTLACAFAFDYERSGVTIYGFHSKSERNNYIAKYGKAAANKKAAENREALRKKRGGAAEEWYTFLSPYAPGSSFKAKFIAENFKIDKLTPSTVQASFIVCNGKSAKYTIKASSGKKVADKNLKVSEKSKGKDTKSKNSDSTGLKTIIFDYKDLKPDTAYKLFIKVVNALGGDNKECEIEFRTPQSLPDSVTNLKIKALDSKLVDKTFRLTYVAPKSWGYWKNNSHGYELHLIVNNKSVAKKTLTSLDIDMKLTPNKYFNYNIQVGDTVQIGLRTWVKNDSGKTIFDSDHITTSNPICLLNKPFKLFLKTN